MVGRTRPKSETNPANVVNANRVLSVPNAATPKDLAIKIITRIVAIFAIIRANNNNRLLLTIFLKCEFKILSGK
jgi:hypothetical protein